MCKTGTTDPVVTTVETSLLSAVERRCLTLAAEGKTPGDIVLATDLPLPRVVDALFGAMEKLDVKNVTGAITRAARLRLI